MPRKWRTTGWILTAIWVTVITTVTRGDPAHPAFNFFFTVPLAGWVIALVVARVLKVPHDEDDTPRP